jgi:hypothetical protein
MDLSIFVNLLHGKLLLGPSVGKDLLEQFFDGVVGKLRYPREQVDPA